jgi:hypothetical protein
MLALLALVALAAGAATAQAAKTNKGAVKNAVKWLRDAGPAPSGQTGFEADSVSALAAARRFGAYVPDSTIDRVIRSLEAQSNDYVGSAGATGKMILAAVAAGRNPRCFGPAGEKSDLYNILRLDYDSSSGRFGRSAYDQALALLALKAARQKIPTKAVRFAKSRRGSYGWNFALSKYAGDNVEVTAIMIEALRAAGVSRRDKALQKAYRWMFYQHNSFGGFNPDVASGATQANTTAYAIRAADALGKRDKKAERALRALQMRNGKFRSMEATEGNVRIATGDAMIALSGRHLPVVKRSTAPRSCV